MRTTIDSTGRIVVPKVLRDELGLEGGSRLEIRLCEGRLEIEPVVAMSGEPLPLLDAEGVRAIVEAQRR